MAPIPAPSWHHTRDSPSHSMAGQARAAPHTRNSGIRTCHRGRQPGDHPYAPVLYRHVLFPYPTSSLSSMPPTSYSKDLLVLQLFQPGPYVLKGILHIVRLLPQGPQLLLRRCTRHAIRRRIGRCIWSVRGGLTGAPTRCIVHTPPAKATPSAKATAASPATPSPTTSSIGIGTGKTGRIRPRAVSGSTSGHGPCAIRSCPVSSRHDTTSFDIQVPA